jgi:hypothetical protein
MGTLARLWLAWLVLPFVGCGDRERSEPLSLPDGGEFQEPPADGGTRQDGEKTLSAQDAGIVMEHSAQLPCAVEQILVENCRTCHGQTPAAGARISLVSHADLTAITTSGVTVFERVKARIHDVQRPMPPVVAMTPLAADALETLDQWLAAGAPSSSESCMLADPPPPAEIDTSECEYLPTLLAHDGQQVSDDEGFSVPLVDDHWECFNFAIPWDKPVQGIAFYPQLDDRRVLHHMVLYALKAGAAPGWHGPCGDGPDRTVVGGWSPGQDRQVPPADTGLLMPHSASGVFQLEIHYNNIDRHSTRDRSGLKVCATSDFRPNTAAVHALGTSDIELPPGRKDVVTSCVVASDKGPATVLAVSPHMHLFGRHLRTVVRHTDGTEETLTDRPYAFADQAILYLPKPITIEKGAVLTTTCSYENDTRGVIGYSEGSDGEMCGNGLLAYPPGSITGGLLGAVTALAGIPNLCTGLGPEPILGL